MQEEIRSFISIDVEDPKILSGVRAVQSSLRNVGADLKIVGGENVHVTLKFLGNVPPEMLSKIGEVLSGLKFSPFTLELSGVGAFPSMIRCMRSKANDSFRLESSFQKGIAGLRTRLHALRDSEFFVRFQIPQHCEP